SGFDHDTGLYHPERPARLKAAAEGLRQSGVAGEEVTAIPLEPADLAIVHDRVYIEAVRRFCGAGGATPTPTSMPRPVRGSRAWRWRRSRRYRWSPPTWRSSTTPSTSRRCDASVRRAGRPRPRHPCFARVVGGGGGGGGGGAYGGGEANRRVRRAGDRDGPAARSPRTSQPRHGFCLFNNVAITGARLRDAGQRVAIVDWDVHHGNGTQEAFYRDPDVLYVSVHQSPFYPFEGMASEVGEGDGAGTVLNVPLPAFTAGDVYRRAYEELVIPALTAFRPDWILVSCGFDAHAQDPLAELRLVEADYAFLAAALPKIVPADRIVVFLEGGYHLPAIRDSMAAVARALVGEVSLSDPSPYQSPPDAHRVVERVASVVRGR